MADDKLEISKARADLILELEKLVGQCAYNPHSERRTYDGEVIRGKRFRYPSRFRTADSNSIQYLPKDQISPQVALSIHYKFGANELEIGKAIDAILKHLEDNHSLDLGEASAKGTAD